MLRHNELVYVEETETTRVQKLNKKGTASAHGLHTQLSEIATQQNRRLLPMHALQGDSRQTQGAWPKKKLFESGLLGGIKK